MSLVCTSIQSFTCILDITDDYLFMFLFFNKYVKVFCLRLTFNVTIFTKLSIEFKMTEIHQR